MFSTLHGDYWDFKDLIRRTASDKILRDKAFNIPENQKYYGYQHRLPSTFYKFFYKNTSGSGIKNDNILNKELAKELHKAVIRKFKKRKVHSPFIDNIWSADLSNMQLISKFDKGIFFLLCVIHIFSKCAWVIPLKDKKCIIITNAFQKILDESNHKPRKIWVDKCSKFYNRSIKWFLPNNNVKTYSTHNEGKSVCDEIFIRTLKNKIYKYMASLSKNVYFDKLDDIVNKYNNTY